MVRYILCMVVFVIAGPGFAIKGTKPQGSETFWNIRALHGWVLSNELHQSSFGNSVPCASSGIISTFMRPQ